MPSGGPRNPTPGKTYANRTDLNGKPPTQPVRAASGQPYGQRGQQEAAQTAMPLPQVTPLGAPTERPGEHVMTGAPTGPGPGPQEVGIPPAPQAAKHADVLEQLQAIYSVHPNDDVKDLIEAIAGGDYNPGGRFGGPLIQ